MDHLDDGQLCILVIDDDPAIAELVSRVLLKEGHQVITVDSAEAGLEQLPYFTFQAAFIDHNLPEMEGLVLGSYLRRNNPFMKIALVTGETDPKLRRLTAQLGITYIAKPFDIELILDVVAEYIREAEQRAEREQLERTADYSPRFELFALDLPDLYGMPRTPGRLQDQLVHRIRSSLQNLRSVARYNERDRVAALAGLLTAQVLGLKLPKAKDGQTYFKYYDSVMESMGRRKEFDFEPHNSV